MPRRDAPPLPRPGLRRLDAGHGRRGRGGRRLPPLVLERAPRRRLQVPHVHRRLRGGPPAGAGLRRAPTGGDDVAILCRNTTEAINHLAYRLGSSPRRRGGHHGGRAPRQPAALGPGGPAALRRVRRGRDLRRRRRGRRPRRRAHGRRCWRSPGPPTSPGGCPPVDEICEAAHARGVPVVVDAAQLAPHRPLPTGRRTSWPSAATSSTRRTVRGLWSGRGPPSPRATRSWPAAERSTWSTSTR